MVWSDVPVIVLNLTQMMIDPCIISSRLLLVGWNGLYLYELILKRPVLQLNFGDKSILDERTAAGLIGREKVLY